MLNPLPCLPRSYSRGLLLVLILLLAAPFAFSQGGPPYNTSDPGTPGNHNWEINFGYMPFYYNGQSISHVPDVDINFGIGDRIQLTYENAWLRVQKQGSPAKHGLGPSNPGIKWRSYDGGEDGLSVSLFPQAFINNPNDAWSPGNHLTSPGIRISGGILQETWTARREHRGRVSVREQGP